MRINRFVAALATVAVSSVALVTVVTPSALAAETSSSSAVTLTCSSSPCPWGQALSSHGVVWPTDLDPTSSRLGYTSSQPVWVPGANANGLVLRVNSGTASVGAMPVNSPGGRTLANLSAGQTYTISGVAAGEIVSASSGQPFTYELTIPDPSTTTTTTAAPTTTTTTAVPTTTTTTAAPSTTAPAGGASGSTLVTLTCSSSPCPWGQTLLSHGVVWPADLNPTSSRLGYTSSQPVWVPGASANGLVLRVNSGTVSVSASPVNSQSGRTLANLSAGQTLTISGVAAGEVVSASSGQPFTYELTTSAPGGESCTDPVSCEIVSSILAHWRCNTPQCTASDWVAGVVSWPAWAAYQSNARAGDQSRTVYSEAGENLFPYMGSWADGCVVTAQSGTVLLIEWQRGTNTWRETYLTAGQSHTIRLTAPENGALIEGAPGFAVTLSNCDPQALP